MAAKFGRGRRSRRKADERDDTTSISDEANRWWTRGDFVQHAVVRTRSHPTDPTVPTETVEHKAGVGDRAVDGLDRRPFSELFTTASLYEPASTEPPECPKTASPRQPLLAPNHPLASALHCLGLDGEATWPDVQQAYRARAKRAHPDRSGDDGEAMAELNATYALLRNGWRYGLFGDN